MIESYNFHQSSEGCTINWIYIGNAPNEGTGDYSNIVTAPQQFSRFYPSAKMCFWILADNPMFFVRLFEHEILQNKMIIKLIDFEELISHSYDLLFKINRFIFHKISTQDTEQIPEAYYADLRILLNETITWINTVVKKISAHNMLKEVYLPLIMAHQAFLKTPSHYFDLSVYLDESAPRFELQQWSHFVLPLVQQFISGTFSSLEEEGITKQEIHILLQTIGFDVFWMYSGSRLDDQTFFLSTFLYYCKNFLSKFPNVKRSIEPQSFFSKLTSYNSQQPINLLNTYLKNILSCSNLRFPAVNLAKANLRQRILGEIFIDAYSDAFEDYLIHQRPSDTQRFCIPWDIVKNIERTPTSFGSFREEISRTDLYNRLVAQFNEIFVVTNNFKKRFQHSIIRYNDTMRCYKSLALQWTIPTTLQNISHVEERLLLEKTEEMLRDIK